MFVYLAYMDDSGLRRKDLGWQVISAVLIPADSFLALEFVSATAIEDLMPEDRRDRFEEFHASELYRGRNAFEGIDQEIRFGAIKSLLSILGKRDFKVAYGAVNLRDLEKSHFGSANPEDVAFRRCVLGVGGWISDRVRDEVEQNRDGKENTTLFIMDQGNKQDTATLQNSFRSLRSRFRLSNRPSSLPFVHDDMYFGDSKFSIGIQIADLCSYFIAGHLEGDSEKEHFYKLIDPQIISAASG